MALVVTLGIGHSLEGRYRSALPRGARLVMGPVGGFGSTYEALAQSNPSLEDWLVRKAGWNGTERVALVCFSAGCFAARTWLERTSNHLSPLAVVLLDGLHGPGPTCEPNEIAGVIAFGRAAMRDTKHRLLVVTNTDIEPAYASTSACSETLLDALGIAHRDGDSGFAPGVVVQDYGGIDAAAHNAQQREVGPELLGRGVVGAWLGGRGISVSPWIYGFGAAAGVLLVGATLVAAKS